ncbi:MAG: hypothetical protein OEV70_12350 [Nitrospirota bacterium]|nr:hypothetical protein [Nitrospirota bacterium]
MARLKKKSVVLTTVMSLACLLQGGMEHTPAEAALKGNEVLIVEEYPSQDNGGQKIFPDLPDSKREGSEGTVLGEKLFQHNSEGGIFQSKKAPRLQLKSPGKLPGIELGVEMHSLQAFQSVIPPENLPKGLDFKQEQPLLLPPSINAPDYNGGFLRFTW